MEITRNNAESLIPLVESRLRECSYFSIDLEFSGIDRDGSTSSFGERVNAMKRLPGDGYSEKRAILKSYTVMQIGISMFRLREKENESMLDIIVRQTGTKATLNELLSFFSAREADPEDTLDACQQVAQSWVDMLQSKAGDDLEKIKLFLPQVLKHATQLFNETTSQCDSVKHFTRTGIVLLRKCEFFARWVALLSTWQSHVTSSPQVAAARDCVRSEYDCDTFYAYLFPAPAAPFENISLNTETVGTFLANNHMDFNQWVQQGLRFGTMSDYLEERANAIQDLVAASELGHLEQLCGKGINDLLPLGANELAYVQWAASLEETAELRPFRQDLLQKAAFTIAFARSGAAHSSPAVSSFVPNSINKAHLVALNGIGLTKRDRRYERLDDAAAAAFAKKASAADATSAEGGDGVAVVPIAKTHGGSALLLAVVGAACAMKKPMVVHNGFTDLMMLMNMLHGDLPETLEEFKTMTLINFPNLYDTRILCGVPAIQDLENLKGPLQATYQALSALNAGGFANVEGDGGSTSAAFYPWVAPNRPQDSSATNALSTLNAHNAGYDAYITGCVFAIVSSAFLSRKVSANTYRGVIPVYGRLYAIGLRQKCPAVYTVPKGNPVYALHAPRGMRTIETVRHWMKEKTAGNVVVSVTFHGSDTYVVEISRMPAGHDIGATMSWLTEYLTGKNNAPALAVRVDLDTNTSTVEAI